MKHLLLTALATAAVTAVPASGVAPHQRSRADVDIMNWMPKASADVARSSFGNSAGESSTPAAKVGMAREAEINLKRLPAADDAGMLDAPDGSIWFYTVQYDKETVDHGTYSETIVSGYTVTVYNAALEEVGAFSDTITLQENETRVAKVEVGPQLTRKFFNIDDKYEVMMALSLNTAEYVNHYRTLVYSLGNDTPVATVPGIYVSAINTATDKWSEKFWITFSTEEETETPMLGDIINTSDYVFSTYKFAGYGGMGEAVLVNRMPAIAAPGEDAIPFLAQSHDGSPWFVFNRLKYCWYLNPYDWEVETPTPGNELTAEIYTTPSSWASSTELYSTTTFPLDATEEDRYFLTLGTFSYNDDLQLSRYGDSPAFILTKATWTSASDEYSYDFDVYSAAPKGETAQAKHLFNIYSNTDAGYFMADIPGTDPQAMFIEMSGDEPEFRMVNLVTGEVEHTLPYRVADGVFLTASTERVAYADGYLYVASQTHGESDDDGVMHHQIAYVNPNGTLHHIDTLNLGKNVDLAQIYSGPDGFDPYTFNLDDKREYMVLVKRREPGQTGNTEELMVVSEDQDAEPLLRLTPDPEMGPLIGITFANLGTENASLIVMYGLSAPYTTVAYDLPLTLFEEGDGTVENPYLITSAGGLDQLRRFPTAHYALGRDIDASGYILSPASFDFTGSLDGRGHIISNLTVEGRAIIPSMSRGNISADDENACSLRNINFANPTFRPSVDAQGLLCGTMMGGIIENVHVYGGLYTSTSDVAGLVGTATLSSRIEASSVDASITSTGGSAAGIAGITRTGSSIKACAYTGALEGTSRVGGIVSSSDNVADRIADCHVNADIRGENTIGGIAGSSSRGTITNCHVEGTMTATAPSRWGGGVKMGGIVGELSQWFASESETEQPEGAVIEGCLVTLTSMTGVEPAEEKYPGQNDTMHRIVGASSTNFTPEETDYDEETDTPIYGDPRPVENALARNYAIATLAVGSDKVAPAADSSEGETVEASAITRDFLSGIGYRYGDETAEPWSQTGEAGAPRLWFEGGLLMFIPSEVSVIEGSDCSLSLALVGQEVTEDMFDSFTCDISDESVLEMVSTEAVDGAILITMKGLAPGTVTVKAGLNGRTAEATVTVTKFNAVTEVATETAAITFDGRTARAEGCLLNVYAVNGTHLLSGRDSVDLSALDGGVYIVTTTAADGSRRSLKLRR